MSNFICCVCSKQLSDHDYKDIFNKNLLIDFHKNNINNETIQQIKLKDAIELMVGFKISKVKKSDLCEACYQKLEFCIQFRSQLISSFESQVNNTHDLNLNVLDLSQNKKDKNISQIETSNRELKTLIKEIKNTTKSDALLNLSYISDNESETNNSLSYKLSNDQRHDNTKDSDDSFDDNSNSHVFQEHFLRIQENDIESEIDVCSGEDDEVLVLDIQCKHNDTISINSSSESEIEVCDYGPTAKKMKYDDSFPSFSFSF